MKIDCKVPKFWDTRNLGCNLPNLQSKRPNLKVFCQNGANENIANSENPDQIWVCTVCSDLSVQKLRVIMGNSLDPGVLSKFSLDSTTTPGLTYVK